MTDVPYMRFWSPYQAQKPIQTTPKFGSVFLPYSPCPHEVDKMTSKSIHKNNNTQATKKGTDAKARKTWTA